MLLISQTPINIYKDDIIKPKYKTISFKNIVISTIFILNNLPQKLILLLKKNHFFDIILL